MVRRSRSLLLAALGLLAVALLTVDTQAAAPTAPGTVTITPTSVTAGTVGTNFSLKYSAPTSRAVTGLVSFNVPAKWSKPQKSTSSGLGFMAVHKGSCSKASLGPVVTNADKSWAVTATVTCAAAKSFTLTYAKVTAPRQAGPYQFTTKAKFKPSTTFLTFANEPSVSVKPGPAAAVAFGTQPSTSAVHALITPVPTVRVLDAYGNQTNTTASVTVAIGANPGGGTLSGTKTVVATAGVATFSDLSIDQVGIGYTLVANSSGLTGVTSSGFNVIGWSSTGRMAFARSAHTATLLPTGKVLVAGGNDKNGCCGSTASAELYDPALGTWSPTGSMTTDRVGHSAVLLSSGKVLVVGGEQVSGDISYELASAELYDPAMGTWSPTGTMARVRSTPSGTLLSNGKVLVLGTLEDASAELYDPIAGTWSTTGSMAVVRGRTTAALLSNGKVLVAGGYNNISGQLPSAEVYDPATGTWFTTGSMAGPRDTRNSTLLLNGKVLVDGGCCATGTSAELYDPASGSWSMTGTMSGPRNSHTATLLSDGRVLVAGGGGGGCSAAAGTELYDPTSGSWSTAGSMASPRWSQTATLLPDGNVLASGGSCFGVSTLVPLADAELYHPAT